MADKSSNAQFQYKNVFLDLLSSDKGFQNQLAETMNDVEILKSKLKYAGSTFGSISTGSNVVFHETSDLNPNFEIDTSKGQVFYISLNTDVSNITIKSIQDLSIIQRIEVYVYQKKGGATASFPSNIFGENSNSISIPETKGFCTKFTLTTFDAGANYLLERGNTWNVNFDILTDSEVKPTSKVKVHFTILDAPYTYYGLSNIQLFDATLNDYISFNGVYTGTNDLAELVLENNQNCTEFNTINKSNYLEYLNNLNENQIKASAYTNIDSVGELVGSFGSIQDTSRNWCSKALISRNPTLVLNLDTNHLIQKVKFNNTVKNTSTAKYFASKVLVQLYYDNNLIKSQVFENLDVDTVSELE